MKANIFLQNLKERFLHNDDNDGARNGFSRFLFPLTGLACLIWLLVRVIPKPSRAQYPCMKVAAPVAGGFLAYIGALLVAMLSFKKARHYFHRSKYFVAATLVVAGISAGLLSLMNSKSESYAFSPTGDSLFIPTDPPNSPMGTAKGIFPGRVVWMRDSTAARWNGSSGNWWDETYTHQAVVDSMLCQSLRALTGRATDEEAWDAMFRYFNNNHGKGDVGYQPGEKIAIKINLNLVGIGNPHNTSFPSPQMVLALLRQLVRKAGVPAANITFYDSNRDVPDAIFTRCRNEFSTVHFMGWSSTGGREKYIRDTTNIHWSQNLTMEINGGHPAYLPTVVTQAAYIISLANFKGHRYVGVTLCSKNHFGTISTDIDGSPTTNAPHGAGLHPYVAVHDIVIPGSAEWSFVGRPMGSYNALVDLMGHKDVGRKTLLFMVDALYGVQSEQDEVSLNSRWLSVPFNNGWTSSLFLSQDNLAIESVGLDFIRTEQSVNPNYTYTYGAVDNYLHEAAQADNPPSGTFYDPEHDGVRLQSLGVHEHWNNSIDKQYTRNLGTGEGIELVPLTHTVTSIREEKMPSVYILSQNYPNPFNPTTIIGYQLPVRSSVTLRVFDAVGRTIATLVNEEKSAGKYSVKFDGKNLASGMYFYRLEARHGTNGQIQNYEQTKKFVVIR